MKRVYEKPIGSCEPMGFCCCFLFVLSLLFLPLDFVMIIEFLSFFESVEIEGISGLTVFLMPKNEFYKTYAIFATKYGSRDTEFIPRGGSDYIKTPEGIAHFLEHKLFEQSDGTDASNIFATLGADVNAFTTNSQTAYLFSTTSDVNECVELLLDFVQ